MKRRLSSAALATEVAAVKAIRDNDSTWAALNRLQRMRLVYHRRVGPRRWCGRVRKSFGEARMRDSKFKIRLVILVLATVEGIFTAAAATPSPATSASPSASPAPVAAGKPRARDLGVPFDGTPGPLNAITDVAGVTVGHTTLISGSGK